jgi:hypoxanthine phosphoribosyltransferase
MTCSLWISKGIQAVRKTMPLPAEEKFRCDLLSWGRIIKDSQKLSRIIRDSGYCPEIVVAIGRGGYVPARILCDCLLVHDLASIKVEHWGTAVMNEKAFVKYPLCAEIRGMKVLLVDDVTDTGDTLRVSLQHLEALQPREIRTAVLIHKTCSTVIPDYYLRKIIKWRWVIFPWHTREDLTELIKKLKAGGICDEEHLRRSMKEKYRIDLPIQTLREISSMIG